MADVKKTGEIFPGRPTVRPGVDFGISSRTENKAGCRKFYSKSDSHSPGMFTVQCFCQYPKLLGLSVMSDGEGVSTALSVLLSRFKKLSRVCYYDNTCNMARSVAIRLQWINESCLIVCDRFH